MRRTILSALAVVVLLAAGAHAERWLHVKVDGGAKNETVKVNVPLSLAEKVLASVKVDKLQGGRLLIDRGPRGREISLDPRELWEAVRTAPDSEFVTVERGSERVKVAKQAGHLVVEVREGHKKGENVDVKIPLPVVEALLSGGQNEIDLLAAVRALGKLGDATLVTVTDKTQSVRIWIDSKNVVD